MTAATLASDVLSYLATPAAKQLVSRYRIEPESAATDIYLNLVRNIPTVFRTSPDRWLRANAKLHLRNYLIREASQRLRQSADDPSQSIDL